FEKDRLVAPGSVATSSLGAAQRAALFGNYILDTPQDGVHDADTIRRRGRLWLHPRCRGNPPRAEPTNSACTHKAKSGTPLRAYTYLPLKAAQAGRSTMSARRTTLRIEFRITNDGLPLLARGQQACWPAQFPVRLSETQLSV